LEPFSPPNFAQSAALRLGLRRGFAVNDSQSFALRNPKGGSLGEVRVRWIHRALLCGLGLPDWPRIAQSAALRLGLRCGFAVNDSPSFALRNRALQPSGTRELGR
jgi:hypothetical protein